MGLSDEILRRGVDALYTSTLFRMAPALFRQIGPAVEMGRSFVCARYQRSAAGLFLLWRGIGRFLAQNPRYRFLFGPVSISAAYAQVSREIMVDFVRAGGHMHPLSRHVRQRNAFVRRTRVSLESGLPPAFQQLLDVEELSSIVADIEPDHRGVPVLFKQYFRLGGKILGFNVDPHFSGVLDLLILVDLLHTDPKILGKYLGGESARAFLEHHGSAQQAAG
jgi:putative hemolysin